MYYRHEHCYKFFWYKFPRCAQFNTALTLKQGFLPYNIVSGAELSYKSEMERWKSMIAKLECPATVLQQQQQSSPQLPACREAYLEGI